MLKINKLSKSLWVFLLLVLHIEVKAQKPTIVESVIWQDGTIPVCWENPSKDNAKVRQWIKDAVTNSWQKESQLKFTCWCPCTQQSEGIHVFIANDSKSIAGKTLAFGNKLNRLPNGLIINADMRNLNFGYHKRWKQFYSTEYEAKVKSVAVHEFGHALGFSHQQKRSDCIFECNEEDLKGEAMWFITSCDDFSVMNYCNPDYSNYGILSALDKEAVRALYKAPLNIKNDTPISLYCSKEELDEISYEFKERINFKVKHQMGGRYREIMKLKKPTKLHNVYVYINGDKEFMNNIKSVDYSLHPGTFDYARIISSDKNSLFGVKLSVWGEFWVQATITYFNNPNFTLPSRFSTYIKLYNDEDIIKQTNVGNRKIPNIDRPAQKGTRN